MTVRTACRCAALVGAILGQGCGRREARPLAGPARPDGVTLEARRPPSPTGEANPPDAPTIRIRPDSVALAPGDPGVQLLADGPVAGGGRGDWTGAVAWEVEPEGVVAVGADGYAHPIGPGRATVRAVFGLDKAEAAISVAPSPGRAWDFAADVVPILTRYGCNAGGCHGKADGRGGFHLSLFGYDPEGDFLHLTRDDSGRRVSPFRPGESLVLGKATGHIPHGGGPRFPADSDAYETVRDWIGAGAPQRSGATHGPLTALAIEPASARLEGPGPRQFRVEARYADGHRRDVTRLASFRVNDDSAAQVDSNGKATLLRRAETDVVVRYQSQVAVARLSTPINPDLAFDFAKVPRRNLNVVDRELFKRLEALKVPPSPRASDAAFLRRASLDLDGRQPTPEQVREFLKDDDPGKRAKLVDRLLADRDFVRFWQIKLGDMLQISNARFGVGAIRYHDWIHESLTANRPWDQVVRALLTGVGDPTAAEGGPVNYALDGADAKIQAEQTARRFLGLRLRCCQCHDHPFDIWTQDDYYGLAAFFAKVGRDGAAPGRMGKVLVKVDPKGQLEHPRTHKAAEPKIPGGPAPKLAEQDDPRAALADWMIGPDNPFFARAAVNWVWAQLFGGGLVEPADDLSRSNPPVHPELLDALAAHFVAHRYDLRDLVRTIATSEAYGLSAATVPGNESDTRLFSHALPRPLTAHQMADALAQVTDVPNRFGALGARRALDLRDPTTPSAILDTFGRCPRVDGCSTVGPVALSLRQSLMLIGGEAVEAKVQDRRGYLANLLELAPSSADIVENLYLRSLCRPPTAEELAHWTRELSAAKSLPDAAEDLFWGLLNSREFAFNH